MVEQEAIRETFYISHGTPKMSIDESIPARQFFQEWKEKVYYERPKFILVISAHWETDVPAVNAVNHSDLIYDFRGFPAIMYQVYVAFSFSLSPSSPSNHHYRSSPSLLVSGVVIFWIGSYYKSSCSPSVGFALAKSRKIQT
uniref:Extradiol ring-cleavage dioxygenase class III enzyme subunit B domain-containing protein n=1 Tax=Opuntia streptacantha TaxID=393608 RepID=A0A7C8ZPB3_OPUST